MDAAAVAEEVTRYAASMEAVKVAAEQAVTGLWASAEDFYDAALVAALAAQAADLSTAGQQQVAGATQEFVTSAFSAIMEVRRPPIPRVTVGRVRNGARLPLVHLRAAEKYRRAFATGETPARALELALGRAGGLIRTDLDLAEREAQRGLMEALGVTQYRRVVRPELSRTGTCGLCIAAADQVYNVRELMPLHGDCKCITLPIVGGNDPGVTLNDEDLQRLYAEAGSTKAADLKRTRFTVNQHGEFGPVLGKPGEHFRGPDQAGLENDPARAARMLVKALPVLERLEDEGGPAGPLGYQRALVARLRRIAA